MLLIGFQCLFLFNRIVVICIVFVLILFVVYNHEGIQFMLLVLENEIVEE